jgi:hypothetical protein
MIKSKGTYIVYTDKDIFCINVIGNAPTLRVVSAFDFRKFLRGEEIELLTAEQLKALTTYIDDKNTLTFSLFEGLELPKPCVQRFNNDDTPIGSSEQIVEWVTEFLGHRKNGFSNSYIQARMEMDHEWSMEESDFVLLMIERYMRNKNND